MKKKSLKLFKGKKVALSPIINVKGGTLNPCQRALARAADEGWFEGNPSVFNTLWNGC